MPQICYVILRFSIYIFYFVFALFDSFLLLMFASDFGGFDRIHIFGYSFVILSSWDSFYCRECCGFSWQLGAGIFVATVVIVVIVAVVVKVNKKKNY